MNSREIKMFGHKSELNLEAYHILETLDLLKFTKPLIQNNKILLTLNSQEEGQEIDE